MNVNRLLGILAILLLTAANALYAQKPVKVKGVQGRWQVSDDITLKQAEHLKVILMPEPIQLHGILSHLEIGMNLHLSLHAGCLLDRLSCHKYLISDPACFYDHRVFCYICHLAANE